MATLKSLLNEKLEPSWKLHLAEYIDKIISDTISQDDFFKDMHDVELKEHVDEMVIEQFDVLKEEMHGKLVQKIMSNFSR